MSLPRSIEGKVKTVYELLNLAQYKLDYYQREYKWKKENIDDLCQDLISRFRTFYESKHSTLEVKRYGSYFLGSIIICKKNDGNYIIDGQQRLTSISLLLMYLNYLQKDVVNKKPIDSLIYSDFYGEASYNINVEERSECINAIYHNLPFNIDDKVESIQNLYLRYQDIQDNYSEEFKIDGLLHFIYWLLDKVEMVEITAYNDDEAYKIFETMNDRGISLNPTEMLKGYLLTKMNKSDRLYPNDLWKNMINELVKRDKKEEENYIRDLLRAKYAITIRERKKDAVDKDFENIGNFHRWISKNEKILGLNKEDDYLEFVKKLNFFSIARIKILEYSKIFNSDFEYIYFNANNDFTLQNLLLLAPLKVEDNQNAIDKKLRLVSGYLDIYIARKVWNQKTLGYSSIVYTMFNLAKEIRDKNIDDLIDLLVKKINSMEETFKTNSNFALNQQNQRFVHRLLARITYYIEKQCGIPSTYEQYVSRDLRYPFEIEHIWADKFEYHEKEFSNENEFSNYRNHIGGLLLIQRGPNQHLGDKKYEEKINFYLTQNLLAKSLNADYYEETNFKNLIKRTGLPFKSYNEFKTADLDERQLLYSKICEEIWNSSRFLKERI